MELAYGNGKLKQNANFPKFFLKIGFAYGNGKPKAKKNF